MGYLNRYLLLLVFNVLNAASFGLILSVAIVNLVDRQSPTNLLIYHGYTGLLSLSLLLSELRAPRFLTAQARFLFTYTGRGLLLTYFGCIVYRPKRFNTVACILVVSLGVLYLVLAWVPFVPLQHGAVHNWHRWCCEGARQFYDDGADGQEKQAEGAPGLPPPLDGQGHGLGEVQGIVGWPGSPVRGSPQPSALDGHRGSTANGSFVYGLTAAARRPTTTTGDEYLDSIVNSSRFARDIMERSDQSIAVRQGSPLPRPYSGLAAELYHDISDPHIV